MFQFNTIKIGKILKCILICGFVLSIPFIIGLPFLIQSKSLVWSISIVYPNGILMLGIAYQFIKLFSSLENNNPFTYENVKILKTTSYFSFGMSILWLLDIFIVRFAIINNDVNYLIVLLFLWVLFFGVGIALILLSFLFQQATDYKTENDLTI